MPEAGGASDERSKDLDDKILQAVVKGMWGGLNLVFAPWRADFAAACHEAMDVARASGNPLVMHSRLTQHIYVELLASHYEVPVQRRKRPWPYRARWATAICSWSGITTTDWLCCIWANGESCADRGGEQAGVRVQQRKFASPFAPPDTYGLAARGGRRSCRRQKIL